MKRILEFLNLLDCDGNLSITNIAVIVCVTKVALVPHPSVTELGTLLVSLVNYMHKRSTNNGANDA